jgi:hypothetical protein
MRLITAVITQIFSYMIQIGVQYGYICTGEAFISVKMTNDPSTVYYSVWKIAVTPRFLSASHDYLLPPTTICCFDTIEKHPLILSTLL